MLILGIESSCDDTSVALLDCSDSGHIVVSEKTASQIEIHKKYGGVVPEIAGRMHAEKIVPLIEEVLKYNPTPDAIAVTSGPGLITGLIVGVEAAKTLSRVRGTPIVATNHIEGHIHSVEIVSKKPDGTAERSTPITQFPALALIVSGGHTDMVLMRDHGDYTILGRTKDDAAGECFDKVAKLLNLPYPGGPQISKLAVTGNTGAIAFPRPMIHENNLDFSFAGLKTSALYWLRDHTLAQDTVPQLDVPAGVYGQQKRDPTINDFTASFEQAIVDVLVSKSLKAAKHYNPKTFILAGGVAANKKLREALANAFSDIAFMMPDIPHAMDNGAMIAVAGYYHAKKREYTRWKDVLVDPNWRVDKK